MGKGKLIVVAVVIAAILWSYWFLKTHGFSARVQPTAVETWIATRLRGLATPSQAKSLKNPERATDLSISEARDHFADHCGICHANNGSGKTEMGAHMYPPAPDMRRPRTQNLTDGEIFYIIKNGVRFTGMPGWGGEDEENWKLVLFIRHLPLLSEKEIDLMKEVNGMPAEEDINADR
jgi:mono/diheme cytochrome c family protein